MFVYLSLKVGQNVHAKAAGESAGGVTLNQPERSSRAYGRATGGVGIPKPYSRWRKALQAPLAACAATGDGARARGNLLLEFVAVVLLYSQQTGRDALSPYCIAEVIPLGSCAQINSPDVN
jgi:hypothetical protein